MWPRPHSPRYLRIGVIVKSVVDVAALPARVVSWAPARWCYPASGISAMIASMSSPCTGSSAIRLGRAKPQTTHRWTSTSPCRRGARGVRGATCHGRPRPGRRDRCRRAWSTGTPGSGCGSSRCCAGRRSHRSSGMRSPGSGRSCRWLCLRIEEVIFNRECRVPFVLAGRPRLASGQLPGLGAGEGPVHRPFPLLRGRRLLPLPASPGRLSAAGSGPRPGLGDCPGHCQPSLLSCQR